MPNFLLEQLFSKAKTRHHTPVGKLLADALARMLLGPFVAFFVLIWVVSKKLQNLVVTALDRRTLADRLV